jgi:hemerythrin
MDHSYKEKNKIYVQSDSFENLIEKILTEEVKISGFNHKLVGKNINTQNTSNIDYLLIDKYGNPTAVIKSLDSDHNKALEKNLDITLWLDNLSINEVKQYGEDLYKRNFDSLFEEKFKSTLSDINKQGINLLLITNLLDNKTETLLDDLINKYRIPINALILEKVKNDHEEYVLQHWFSKIDSDSFTDIYKLKQLIPSWNNSYSLDIPIIDNQHKMFFKIYDELIESNTQTITDEQKLNIIEQLEKYVLGHFQTEEILFKRANYSESEQHIYEHKLLINKVNEFKVSYEYKNTQLVNQMLVFIRKWFLSHISNTDAQYKNAVKDYIHNLYS